MKNLDDGEKCKNEGGENIDDNDQNSDQSITWLITDCNGVTCANQKHFLLENTILVLIWKLIAKKSNCTVMMK